MGYKHCVMTPNNTSGIKTACQPTKRTKRKVLVQNSNSFILVVGKRFGGSHGGFFCGGQQHHSIGNAHQLMCASAKYIVQKLLWQQAPHRLETDQNNLFEQLWINGCVGRQMVIGFVTAPKKQCRNSLGDKTGVV
jgi:hypothetical protein